MKQTIGFYEFARAFENLRPDNFSRSGLSALFDYLEQYEEDVGEDLELDVIELDVIAFCCYFSEDWADNIAADYSIDLEAADGDLEEIGNIVREYLQDEGAYVGEAGEDENGRVSFVYRQF